MAGTTRADKSKSSFRAALKEQLGPEIVPDMAKSIRAALESTKTEWIECSHCHKKTAFAIPNMYERAKAAQMVLSELEGKVGTHREVPVAAKTVGDLDELSDDALLALLNASEPENGDSDEDERPEP